MYEITLDYLGMTLNKTTGAVLKSGTSKVVPVAYYSDATAVQNCTVQEFNHSYIHM